MPLPRAELSHLATEDERDLARRHVYTRLVNSAQFHAVSIAFILIETVVCFGAVWLLGSQIAVSSMRFAIVGLAGGVIGLGMMAASFFVLRKTAARLLRQHLNACGIPVCVACGYNRTGVEGPVCPECGLRPPR